MLPHIPGGGGEGGDEASGKNSAGLQCVDAEDVAGVAGVEAPVVDDVEHLGADDAAEDDENAQVPRLVAVNAEAFGIAHADPQADQDAGGDQESIGGEKETADMEELGEHGLLDAGKG